MKKLAIVIGGSSGIGRAICHDLKEDYRVINMSRRPFDEVNNIRLDVEDYTLIKSAFKALVINYGIPDIMIYSAGFVQPQGLLEIENDIWDKTFNVNIRGAFYCTQEFVKYNKTSGKIIYIASTAGTRPQPGWVAYSSAKSALINFSLTMSEELKNDNIKVYCLTPARCATDLRRRLAEHEDQSKIMQPQEVSKFIKYIIY